MVLAMFHQGKKYTWGVLDYSNLNSEVVKELKLNKKIEYGKKVDLEASKLYNKFL